MWPRRSWLPLLQKRKRVVLLAVWKKRNQNSRVLPEEPGKCQRTAPRVRGGGGPEKSSPASITAFKQTNSRLLAEVVLGGQRWEATIDTGASRSYISERVARELAECSEVFPVESRISLANGATVEVRQVVRVEVRLGGRGCRMELGVMPQMLDNVLLGLDFLGAVNCEMRCGDQQIQFEPTTERVMAAVERQEVAEPPNNQPVEKLAISQFLEEEMEKFKRVRGLTTLAEHKIILKDDRPVRQRYAQRNPEMQRRINEEIDELLRNGCIEPSKSPYSAPIVMAPKKNGSLRLCIDYRLLPRINAILDRLRNANYISSIDLKNGYWQIPMAEDSKEYTAFTVAGKGLFQWKVMPFGLTSAPATFQRTLDRVIGAEMEPHAFAYLDDIVVLGSSLEEHMSNLKEVFRRLREARLTINTEKCKFFQKEIKYLGHVVNENGIKTDPEKIAAIGELRPPKNVKELRRCLGMLHGIEDLYPISQGSYTR